MGLGCCASSRAGSNLVRARLGLGLGLDSSNLRSAAKHAERE